MKVLKITTVISILLLSNYSANAQSVSVFGERRPYSEATETLKLVPERYRRDLEDSYLDNVERCMNYEDFMWGAFKRTTKKLRKCRQESDTYLTGVTKLYSINTNNPECMGVFEVYSGQRSLKNLYGKMKGNCSFYGTVIPPKSDIEPVKESERAIQPTNQQPISDPLNFTTEQAIEYYRIKP